MEDVSDKGRGLSELPEHVLSHILSFLPTKEAVRTSILSKRWEYIWTSIPKLNFVQGDTLPMDFVNIIDRSLRLRGPFDIISFSINCDIDEDSEDIGEDWGDIDEDREGFDIMPHVESWISDVVRFNVQDVELRLLGDSTLILPFSFVNCRTLTSLTISGRGFIALEFPSPVCFSNLKKLQLCGVTFPNEHSTQKIFSGCPMLEDMILEKCDWGNVKAAVSVASQRLQSFTMIEDKGPLEENFNGDEFVICGGALINFNYAGQFQFDFNILNSQLLKSVVIDFYSHMNDPILVKDHFLRLLRSTPNVEILTLNSCLIYIPEIWIHIPMFNGVWLLELDYESSDLSNTGLWKMLQNMPGLECIWFSKGINMASYPIEDNILNPLPPCFLSSLRYILVSIWEADAVNLMGVEVLLKNAMVLKKMTVKFVPPVNEDERNNFCIELLKLPRGSKECRICL